MKKLATQAEAGHSEEEPVKRLGLSKYVSWGGVSGNYQGGTKALVMLMESTNLCYLSWVSWVREELNKGAIAPASVPIPRESCSNPC